LGVIVESEKGKLMKRFNLVVVCFFLSLSSSYALSETATDRLLTKIMDKQIPAMLHEARDQPWTGGTYAIRIFRNGAPVFKSDTEDMSVSLPLRAEIEGNAGLLNSPIICRADFKTMARVDVQPDYSAGAIRAKSKVTLPIPKVVADCGVIEFPVEAFLEQLVSSNKAQWEMDIDKALNTELKKLAL
jgi:hypothetical protein